MRIAGLRAVVAVCCMVLLAATALGLINPKFTPIHLAKESEIILAGVLTTTGRADEWTFAIDQTLKGRAEARATLVLAAGKQEEVEGIRQLLPRDGEAVAVLFASGRKKGEQAYLHVAGTWLSLKAAGLARWDVESLARRMSGVYAGGTDMLVRMTRYILTDPRAAVPVSAGTAWMSEVVRLGTLDGEIGGMTALEWGADKRTYLFVASSKGDRLFRARPDDEAFDDATAETRLDTRSRQFAWLDLRGRGRPCLLSWDGKAVQARELEEDGTFRPLGGPARTFDDACLGLAACSVPGSGGPALLVSTSAMPLLLGRGDAGEWTTTALPGGPVVRQAGDFPSACIVADLDNDGFWDVLQPRRRGGVLWRGRAEGLAEPVRSDVGAPDGPCRFALGDFNQDGYLDIFLCSPTTTALWENDGAGGFRDVVRWAGSLAYKASAGYADCRAADLNHDGRLDLCLLHPKDSFTYHFNRGFRCLGEEGELRLHDPAKTGESSLGQQAGAVADFNGDGSLDLAVALADGQVCCYYNDSFNKPLLRVRLAKGVAGPVTVSLWPDGDHPVCMSALSVGETPAKVHFGVGQPGRYTVRWRLPGGPPCRRQVTVLPGAAGADLLLDK